MCATHVYAQGMPRIPVVKTSSDVSSPSTKTSPDVSAPTQVEPEQEELPMVLGASRENEDIFENDKLFVHVAIECASEDSNRQLLEELRLRLPEHITIVQYKPDNTRLMFRELSWTWRSEQGCRLVFKDLQGEIELPLPHNPEPEQLRQAVVRVAWFVSMSQEEEPVAKPRPEVVARKTPVVDGKINGMPVIASVDDHSEGQLLAPPQQVARATSDSPTVQPASAGSEKEVAAFSNVMSNWKLSSPNLFKKFRDFDRQPLKMNVGGDEIDVGANLSLATDLVSLRETQSWLVSGRLGADFGDRFGAGIRYKRLTSTVLQNPNWDRISNPPEDAFTGFGQLRLNLLGADVEALLWQKDEWKWRASFAMEMGRLKSRSLDGGSQVTSFVMFSELQTQVFLAMLPWLDVGVGLGYRFPVMQANDWVAAPAQMRGGLVSMTLRLKLF